MNEIGQKTRLRVAGFVVAAAFALLPLTSAEAEIHEHEGAYGKLGIGLGFIDPDGNLDVDPGAGFAFAAGYHVAPWLAVEADLSVVAGAKLDVPGDFKATGVGFTIGAKGYPLGAMDTDLPEWFDPYAIFGIGGGNLDVDGLGDDGSFLVRFAFGFEVMKWDNLGAYVQGGYDIVTEDLVDGVGHLVVGGIYRFNGPGGR